MKKTIAWSFFVAVAIFIVLAGKFGYIQLIQSSALQKDVVDLRVKQIKELPERGKITDVNGRTLAMSLNAKNIAIYPNMMTSDKTRDKVATLLSTELKKYGVTYESVLKDTKLKDKKGKALPWYGVASRVEPEIAANIKKKDTSGAIEISDSPKRYYPNGNLASSILGYINHENNPGAGLELSLNSYLAGIPGYTLAELDSRKHTIPIGFQNASSPVAGQKVTLSIDSYIQYTLEQRLKQAMKEWNPESVHGIIMDPNTGEVIAMASMPNYDPNKYTKYDPKTWTNNPVGFTFEPGSVLKPIVMGIALNSGSVKPDQTYDDPGYYAPPNAGGAYIVHDAEGSTPGTKTLSDIISQSLNVGMDHVIQSVSNKTFIDGLKAAGFGKTTGIELPGEGTGIVANLNDPEHLNPVQKDTMAFGQGIAVTPIQEITAFSELINGGHKIQAHLMDKVTDNFGNVVYQAPSPSNEQVYKPEVSKLLRSYLLADWKGGTFKPVAVDGYDGGGKTGTANVTDGNGSGYGSKYISSVIGFVPYDHPKYVMLVDVVKPTVNGVAFGAMVAGPIFKDVMTQVLQYKDVPKTNPLPGETAVEKQQTIKVPNMEYFLYEDAKAYLEKQIPDVVIKKSGHGEVVVGQKYRDVSGVLHVTLVTQKINDQPYQNIPYLGSKTKEEVKSILDKYHIKATFHGSGKVKEQSVEPGVYSRKTDAVSFWLK